MQKLEAMFEVPLFHRTKNSISLNEIRLLAAEDAAMLLKQTENMLRHARDFDRAGRTIKLGSCTPAHVAEIIQRITAFYPTSAIASEVKDIPHLLEEIKDETCQFVLLPFCPEDDDLYYREWGEEHLSFLQNDTVLPAGNA